MLYREVFAFGFDNFKICKWARNDRFRKPTTPFVSSVPGVRWNECSAAHSIEDAHLLALIML
jgi:hypothetical protein